MLVKNSTANLLAHIDLAKRTKITPGLFHTAQLDNKYVRYMQELDDQQSVDIKLEQMSEDAKNNGEYLLENNEQFYTFLGWAEDNSQLELPEDIDWDLLYQEFKNKFSDANFNMSELGKKLFNVYTNNYVNNNRLYKILERMGD